MSERINLADPSFEPTDEQLQELSKRAFADARAKRVSAEADIRAQIAAARAEALRDLEARLTVVRER